MIEEFLWALVLMIRGIMTMIGGICYFTAWSFCIVAAGFYLTDGFSHTLVWWFYS